MKQIAILIILLGLHGCGQESADRSFSETESLGSWAFSIGGSLKGKGFDELGGHEIRDVSFYHVKKHVALGINHEYVGVVVDRIDGSKKFYTTGLIATDDDSHFQEDYLGRRKFSTEIRRTHDRVLTEKILNSIEEYMNETVYRNQGVYVLAMVSTPLTGRPCANSARKIRNIIIAGH